NLRKYKRKEDPFDMKYKNGSETPLRTLEDQVNESTNNTLEDQVNESTNNTLEDQVNESTNNTLMISETIDITNLSFSSDGQLQVNMPTNSNLVENQNWLGNLNYNTEDLVNRMFEMND
ncbi:18976_t:CDS:2, partial [Racocetra persica]